MNWQGPRLNQLLPPTERTWRGVQIPIPEGIDFVHEVVTNHAVSGGLLGKVVGPHPSAVPDSSPALPACPSCPSHGPLHQPCIS